MCKCNVDYACGGLEWCGGCAHRTLNALWNCWWWIHVNIGGYLRCLQCNLLFYGCACVWCWYCVVVTATTGTVNMCMHVILGRLINGGSAVKFLTNLETGIWMLVSIWDRKPLSVANKWSHSAWDYIQKLVSNWDRNCLDSNWDQTMRSQFETRVWPSLKLRPKKFGLKLRPNLTVAIWDQIL